MEERVTAARQFEDLRIWQDARELVRDIYRNTGVTSKAGKDWGFRDQIQRSAMSIMNNIAEGFERSSKADFARFLDMAKGSSGEVRSILYVGEDLGYFSSEACRELRKRLVSLSRGIAALSRHLRKS